MAKQNDYQEKTKPILVFLYIIVAIALVAALVLMYQRDRVRRRQFEDLVIEASSDETSEDIAARKDNEQDMYGRLEQYPTDAPEATDAPEPAATDTPAPTDAPAATPTNEPEATEPPKAEEPTSTPYIPQDDLVDESLAQGLED